MEKAEIALNDERHENLGPETKVDKQAEERLDPNGYPLRPQPSRDPYGMSSSASQRKLQTDELQTLSIGLRG